MKKLLLLFCFCASLCSANTYTFDIHGINPIARAANAAEEIEVVFTNKEVQGSGRYANLVLTGKHDTYGTIAIYLNEYNGKYKTYEVYYATVGKHTVSGSAQWSKDGDVEKLEATLSTADFGTTPGADDLVFHIIGTYTPARSISLDFLGFSKYGYDANYGDWYMEIMGNDPDAPTYQYKVVLAYYAPAENGLGTFTSAKEEINLVDSYILTPAGAYVMFDSVVLNMAQKQVSKTLKQTIATITAWGQDGVTYHITCTHNTIIPSQTFTGEINNATLQRSEEMFTFAGSNSNYEATFTVKSNTFIGKHTKSIDLAASKFVHKGKTLEILTIQAAISTKTIGQDLACVAQVAFLTKDTAQYVITLIHTLPTPTTTVDVRCTDVIVSDDLAGILGVVNFNASNDNYTVTGTWQGTEAQEGSYTKDQVSIELKDNATNQLVRSLDASIEAKLDDNQRWTVTGTMRGDNNVLYNLQLVYEVPTPTDTVEVRFETSARAEFNPDMNNDLYFENADAYYFASLNIRGVEMGGTFGLQDVDREFCGVKDSLTGVSTNLADVNGRIFQVGDTTIMQAELISMDATLYDIELWYVVPTPIDTVRLSFPVEFGDMRSEQGFYQLFGPSPDTTYAVAFSPMSEEIPGTFVNDGMFGKFGAEGGRLEMEHRNSYIVKMEGNIVTAMMAIEKGQMTVEMDENGDITAVAEVICADSVYYHVTMTSHYERVYLRGDKQTGSVDKTYTAADVLTIVDDYIEEGYIYLAVGAANQTDLMAMHIFADSTDADIIIPEGVYPINKSFRPGTVLASFGPDENNQLTTPFYATANPILGYLQDIYMWVKGTVTVEKREGKLYLEVQAVNSYDVPIHIVYDATLTDVTNIHTPERPTKYIQNAQLIIEQNGVKYNAQGAVL